MSAALVSAALAGCGLSKEVAQGGTFAAPGTAYRTALDEHTRRAELYRDLDTIATAWATWKSPALRGVLVEAAIVAYGAEKETAEGMRRDDRRAAAGVWEFHVALYAPKKDWNDLESPDSLWRVRLELPGGKRLDPVRVEVVSKSDRSGVQYPYVSPWTREYAVFFPKLDEAESSGSPTLVVAGPLGKMVFAF